AAEGPLGSDLLSIGSRALREAAIAWRDAGVAKSLLADEIDKALDDWGTVPLPVPVLMPGDPVEAVVRYFPDAHHHHSLVPGPERLPRLLDVLDVPVVDEGVVDVVAFLDNKHTLSELQFVYKSRVAELFPEPQHLAHHLLEAGVKPGQVKK